MFTEYLILIKMFETGGKLKLSRLNEIYKERKISDQYPENTHPFIINMMKKFELCFEFEGKRDEYLIPDLLPKEQPDLNWDDSDTLNFQYHYNFLPNSVISRFIVLAHSLVSKRTYWRTGVVLKNNNNKALVKADLEDRKIFISITGKEKTRWEFLTVIRSHFNHIHDSIVKIEANEKVPLPEHKEIVLDYKDLLGLEEMGKLKHPIPKLKIEVDIKLLLDGIELPEERMRERETGIYEERGRSHKREKPSEQLPVKSNPWVFGLYLLLAVILVTILYTVINKFSGDDYTKIIGSSIITVIIIGLLILKFHNKIKDKTFVGMITDIFKLSK